MSHERAARRPRTYLNIDFDKKDHAKRHGAQWDVQRKSWYVLGDVPAELLNYVAPDPLQASLARLQARDAETEERAKSTLRRPPPGDEQADFEEAGAGVEEFRDALARGELARLMLLGDFCGAATGAKAFFEFVKLLDKEAHVGSAG